MSPGTLGVLEFQSELLIPGTPAFYPKPFLVVSRSPSDSEGVTYPSPDLLTQLTGPTESRGFLSGLGSKGVRGSCYLSGRFVEDVSWVFFFLYKDILDKTNAGRTISTNRVLYFRFNVSQWGKGTCSASLA